MNYDLPGGWSIMGTQVWNLSHRKWRRDNAKAALKWTGGVQNCLTFNLDYDRDLDSDRDIASSDQFMLTVTLNILAP